MMFLGIDVAKATLDVALIKDPAKPRHKVFANTPAGHQQLLRWLRDSRDSEASEVHACLEATGTYAEAAALALNLIGNALKYSDNAVRVTWRPAGERLLIAVCDQGMGGRGITRTQAEKLFTAFGRLDTHAAIEGTGLGLLSVRKIVEAHGGEAFIVGYADGTPASAPFSTALHGPYPSLLSGQEATAFVVTCPLVVQAAQAAPSGETATVSFTHGTRT